MSGLIRITCKNTECGCVAFAKADDVYRGWGMYCSRGCASKAKAQRFKRGQTKATPGKITKRNTKRLSRLEVAAELSLTEWTDY